MSLTYQDAIDLLKNDPASYATIQQLSNLASQISVDIKGEPTVLYSGNMPDGTYTGDVVNRIPQDGIRILDYKKCTM